MATATVYIHGGDYDCSDAVRMCYRAVGVLPYGSYMWTGNEVELLTAHGFKARSLSNPKVGDVLWREGHTEMYLGDGMQGGPRIDERGGITGPLQGDQTGNEVTRSAYKASGWTKLLRYEGGATVEGIPCAIAAAQVMDHIIDHAAHGYSQDNRKGDGTIEPVAIAWDDGSTVAKPIAATFRFTVTTETNVRSAPSMDASVTGTLPPGYKVTCDGWLQANGRIWATYLAASGKRRYVSLGTSHSWVVVS